MATKKSVEKIVKESVKETKPTPKAETKKEVKAGKYRMTATFCGQFSIGIFKEGQVYSLSSEQAAILAPYIVEEK